MRSFILTGCLVVAGFSCSKDPATQKDREPPVILISDPVNGQVFTAGQTIFINSRITDNEYLAEIHIHISNINTGALLFDAHTFPGGSRDLQYSPDFTAVAGINYRIQVIAKDLALNESIASVNVSCN